MNEKLNCWFERQFLLGCDSFASYSVIAFRNENPMLLRKKFFCVAIENLNPFCRLHHILLHITRPNRGMIKKASYALQDFTKVKTICKVLKKLHILAFLDILATFRPPGAEKLFFSDKTLACLIDLTPKHRLQCRFGPCPLSI